MFEDPKLFRQARTRLKVSMREIAEIAGEKESSFADAEAGRKKFRDELAFKGWAALWDVMVAKKQRFTPEQMENNENLLDMMLCAHSGLAIGVSPDKLLTWFRGEGEIDPEEKQRFYAHIPNDPGDEKTGPKPLLTFHQARQMPLADVIEMVTREFEDSQLNLLLSLRQTPEEHADAIKAQVNADPRTLIAGAQVVIKQIQRERDDLRRELLEANKELLETYRRVAALEKELEQERQPK